MHPQARTTRAAHTTCAQCRTCFARIACVLFGGGGGHPSQSRERYALAPCVLTHAQTRTSCAAHTTCAQFRTCYARKARVLFGGGGKPLPKSRAHRTRSARAYAPASAYHARGAHYACAVPHALRTCYARVARVSFGGGGVIPSPTPPKSRALRARPARAYARATHATRAAHTTCAQYRTCCARATRAMHASALRRRIKLKRGLVPPLKNLPNNVLSTLLPRTDARVRSSQPSFSSRGRVLRTRPSRACSLRTPKMLGGGAAPPPDPRPRELRSQLRVLRTRCCVLRTQCAPRAPVDRSCSGSPASAGGRPRAQCATHTVIREFVWLAALANRCATRTDRLTPAERGFHLAKARRAPIRAPYRGRA